MKVSTTEGNSFELLKTVCRDHRFQATRIAVKKSIDTNRLFIRQYKRDQSHFVAALDVSTSLTLGHLRLGCHTFSREATKKILTWAGIKKAS